MFFTSQKTSVKIADMKRARWIARLFVVLASVLVLMAFSWLLFRGKKQTKPAAQQPEADLILINSQLTEFERGNPVYSLNVTETVVDREKNQALLHGILARYYHEGAATLHLTAATGVVDTTSGDAVIVGDPQVAGPSHYLLTTDRLNYHGEKRYISAAGEVKIAGPLFDLTGRGLDYYPAAQTFTVQENVKTVIRTSLATAETERIR